MKKAVNNLNAAPICSRLKQLRLKLGFPNKVKFCRLLGVLPQTYQNYENDRIPPSDFLFKLSDKFKHSVDIDWLLTGQGTPPDKRHEQRISNAATSNSVTEQEAQSSDIIEIEHSNMIKQFRDKALAKAIDEDLIRLESINKDAFREVGTYIKGLIQGLKLASGRGVRPDRRKYERRQQSDVGKIPEGVDRRSGIDRRQTGS